MRLYLYGGILAALVLAFGASNWYSHHTGYAGGEAVGNARVAALTAQYAEASAKAAQAAQAKQTAAQNAIADIDAKHAQELKDAQAKSVAVVADLRAGTLRLRQQWRGCEASARVSGAATGADQPDASANLRAASAAAIVRAASDADAQIRALQAIVKLDRQ